MNNLNKITKITKITKQNVDATASNKDDNILAKLDLFNHNITTNYTKQSSTNVIDYIQKKEDISQEVTAESILKKIQDMHKKYECVDDGTCTLDTVYTVDLILSENPTPITKICNVYQSKYRDNKNSPGFGDYIRGTYFLLDYCERTGQQFAMIINHPISNFLQNPQCLEKNIEAHVSKFNHKDFNNATIDEHNQIHTKLGKNNIPKLTNFLQADAFVHENTAHLFTNAYPEGTNTENHKSFVKTILEPSLNMTKYINNTLSNLKITKNNYITIHIRCGDNTFLKNSDPIFKPYTDKLIAHISKIFEQYRGSSDDHSLDDKFLIISDNLILKTFLIKMFPFAVAVFKNITHLGEGIKQEADKVKNTLLDFYLLSFSKKIFSFSSYGHGSGFSEWCAFTYNIPYVCRFIPK